MFFWVPQTPKGLLRTNCLLLWWDPLLTSRGQQWVTDFTVALLMVISPSLIPAGLAGNLWCLSAEPYRHCQPLPRPSPRPGHSSVSCTLSLAWGGFPSTYLHLCWASLGFLNGLRQACSLMSLIMLPFVVLQVLRSCLAKCEWCFHHWECVWVLPSAIWPCLSLLTSWETGSSCSLAYPCPAWSMSPCGGWFSSSPDQLYCPHEFF